MFVYSVEKLMPFRRALGEAYVFDDDVVKMCQENALVAQCMGRKDLAQTWNVAAQVAANKAIESNNTTSLWTVDPFGHKLISSM